MANPTGDRDQKKAPQHAAGLRYVLPLQINTLIERLGSLEGASHLQRVAYEVLVSDGATDGGPPRCANTACIPSSLAAVLA